MELRHLKYFVKAAETLNFSEAAKSLAVTQSTLSQQLRQLESEMKVQLFERNSHCVNLTEAGRELLPYALDTLHAADACFNRLEDLNSLLTGTLDIGVTYSFSPILAETLVEFMHLHPGVKLNVQYRTMDELMDRLSKREVDFVLAFKPTTPHEGIESHTLFDTRLAAVVRNNHPLAQQKSVTLHDLQRFSLALPAKGLQARSAFENIAGALPLDLNVNMEVNDVNILLKLVKSTSLVTLLAEATIYGDSEVKAVPIAAVGNEISGCVHLLRDVYRKRSALEFLRMLQQSPAIRARMEGWI